MATPSLVEFAAEARARVASGFYDLRKLPEFCPPREPPSLAGAIERVGRAFPVIAEVKPASPSAGALRVDADAGALARAFVGAGARGVSALVPRERFGGSPGNVIAATTGGVPVLFKDFVLAEEQLKCARRCGASAVLLIDGLVDEASTRALLRRAHELSLEVLFEVYDREGVERALGSEADLVGVNNRDLRRAGHPVDLAATERALAGVQLDRPVVSLSGVESRADLLRVRNAGAHAALVGSALMRASDPAGKLREILA